MQDCKLTTIDNPFNPFTQSRDWLNFDVKHGYNTQRWIAFFSVMSPKMDDEIIELEVDAAMNEVLEVNPYGMHIKVYKDEADVLIPLANKAYKDSLKQENNKQSA